MSVRLIGKAFKLATRSTKRFIMFTVVYAAIIGWTAFSVQGAYDRNFAIGATETMYMIVAIAISVFISMVYANIIVNYRRIELATLKCIGWRNNAIRVLIVGEIMSVTLIAFFIVFEFMCMHWVAIAAYIKDFLNQPATDIIPITMVPLIVTFGLMLVVQIAGILLANTKILKVRPIQALQMRV